MPRAAGAGRKPQVRDEKDIVPEAPKYGSGTNAVLRKIGYTHDAMIDLILSAPGISQRAMGAHFGYTEGWVSQVINSSAFQARLAERKGELTDPTIAASLEEQMGAIAHQALGILRERLEANRSADVAIKVLDISARALGFGARDKPTVQNNYVVNLPPKAASTEEWARQYGRPGEGIRVNEPITVEAARVEASD